MGTKRAVACLQVALILFLNVAPLLHANPTGEDVAAGSAAFDRAGSTLTVTTSDRVIINWQDFSIGASELTKFVQPSVSSAALNRVVSGNPSAIYGTLQANGQIFLINPNGILIGNGAVINTGGFTASTLDLNNSEFMAGGNLNFTGNSTAKVENQGRINAIGGDIYLIARQVENKGELNAPDGTVGLAAGNEVLLTQAGEEKIFVKPSQNSDSATGTGILNSGTIQAARAELKATGNIYALAINNTGVIRANGVTTRNGHVFLTATGGEIRHSGTITAKNADGRGGKIVMTADRVGVTKHSLVDASGQNGGGTVIVFASDTALVHGDISATGGGGFVETSGKEYLEVLSAPEIGDGGSWLIDPRDLRIVAGGGLSNLTVTGTPAAPVGTSTGDSATLGVDLVNNVLNNGANVIIQTGGTGVQAGNLTMDPGINISKTSGGAASLTMNAHNNLSVNGISSTSGTLTLTLNADSDNSGAGAVTINGAIALNGGNGAFNGRGVTVAGTGSINAGAGTVSLNGNTGAIAIGGSITGSQISLNGAGVNQTGGALTATGLKVTGGAGTYNIQQVGNDIATLAASVGGGFSYRDANSFTVGTVAGLSGVQTTSSTLSLLAPSITINNTPVAGADVQGPSTVDLIADNLTINGTVSSGTIATLRQWTAGQAINLGGADGAGTLGLSAAELNNVSAVVVRVGNAVSGNITVSAPIAPAGTTILNLITGGGVIDGNAAGTDITVANLAIQSATGIGSGNPLETVISNLAFNNSTSGNVEISNTGALSILSGAPLGIPTSANAGGAINLTAASPITFAVNTTAAGNLSASAGESAAATDHLTVNGGVTVRSTGGNVTLSAGDNVVINAGGVVRSDLGDVTLIAGNDFINNGTVQAPGAGGDITAVADNDFPTAPGFGTGVLNQNGTFTVGGRILLYAVQPSQVLPSAGALVPPAQWVYSTYFNNASGAAGNVLAFKIANPSGGGGSGGGSSSQGTLLVSLFDDQTDRYYRPQNTPVNGPHGIYYNSTGLNAAPPNLGSDAGLDAAPPHGLNGPVKKKAPKNLTVDSSFGAFASEAAPQL